MIIEIKNCEECPALDGHFESFDKTEYLIDCKLSRKKSRAAEKGVIPDWCSLRQKEVTG